jgi:hypothetical protein
VFVDLDLEAVLGGGGGGAEGREREELEMREMPEGSHRH